ncbi:hypothetical protein COCON_G00136550 [Conger conger]|uniref:Ig-like domain-containing protein n=1 Tax=Conger conger TaxID=82655 RepID=A0A9Q1DEV1_CONCO|nr:hypothetical protein COCON_G00136550 [Conger conger]
MCTGHGTSHSNSYCGRKYDAHSIWLNFQGSVGVFWRNKYHTNHHATEPSGCTFVGVLTMETMLVCVWLVSSLIHTISGCSLSAPEGVTGYTGGSVLLPCFCTDGGTIPRSARWLFQPGPTMIILWSHGRVDDRYKDRALISDSPGNMSLRLSDLTLSDWGTYWCEADGQFKDITLTVKECSLSAPGGVTGYTGGSVLLPCICTNGGTISRSARWFFLQNFTITLWSRGQVDDRYKARALILVSPGNMSLRLSDLGLSDEGTYRCETDGHYREIRLTVKVCDFSDSGPIPITGFTGHSVVLPCACTEVQIKPKQIKWTADLGNQNTAIFPQGPTSGNDR